MGDIRKFADQAARIAQFKDGLKGFFALKIQGLETTLETRINDIFEKKIDGEIYTLKNRIEGSVNTFKTKEGTINTLLSKLETALNIQQTTLTTDEANLKENMANEDAILGALRVLDEAIPEIDFSTNS